MLTSWLRPLTVGDLIRIIIVEKKRVFCNFIGFHNYEVKIGIVILIKRIIIETDFYELKKEYLSLKIINSMVR